MFWGIKEKLTHKEQVKRLLADKKWHSFCEFNSICWRYSARMFELQSEGIGHEKKLVNGVWYYRGIK